MCATTHGCGWTWLFEDNSAHTGSVNRHRLQWESKFSLSGGSRDFEDGVAGDEEVEEAAAGMVEVMVTAR